MNLGNCFTVRNRGNEESFPRVKRSVTCHVASEPPDLIPLGHEVESISSPQPNAEETRISLISILSNNGGILNLEDDY